MPDSKIDIRDIKSNKTWILSPVTLWSSWRGKQVKHNCNTVGADFTEIRFKKAHEGYLEQGKLSGKGDRSESTRIPHHQQTAQTPSPAPESPLNHDTKYCKLTGGSP